MDVLRRRPLEQPTRVLPAGEGSRLWRLNPRGNLSNRFLLHADEPMPVLVYHHARDGCKHCQASDTPAILQGLTRALVKKLMVVDGGSNPVGDECAAQHWHGFIGMEQEAIGQITAWIQAPKP